jgi:hypothetical protein
LIDEQINHKKKEKKDRGKKREKKGELNILD